jgi:hypothetical protein
VASWSRSPGLDGTVTRVAPLAASCVTILVRPLWLLVWIVCWAGPVTAAPYPEPPQQHAAWIPAKSALDGKVVAAMKRLFDEGFADPRGCDYRELDVVVTHGWEDAATTVRTHGWVIASTQFAIAWNGLVYRAASIGAAANVGADIRAMLDAHTKARDEAKRDDPAADFVMWPRADESYYVAFQTLAPGKAMMLLRLGEAALADRVWKATAIRDNAYALLADDYLWAQFARGAGAHHRGDVDLAIESWRRLPALAKTARTDVAGSGVIAGDQGARYLDDIAALLADEQRRAAHPVAPINLGALAKLPPRDRIAQLIAALDQVQVMARFGGPDPIVKALVDEGEAAVEPLIAAYQTDTRYSRTRFVDIKHGDADRIREITPVHQLAHDALAQLVDLSYFQPTATDRRAVADELRAYWKRWKGVSPLERQYQVLSNDKLDEEQWFVAAFQITATTGSKLAGESLRTKSTPAVTALFQRRLDAGYSEFRQRARMLQAFAAWDAVAAKPYLAKTVRDGFASWSTAPHQGMDPYIGEALAALTTARIAAGDATALREYADWIVTTTPEQAQFAAHNWFAPMIAHAGAPEMVRAATVLFKSSPWVPLTAKRAGFYSLELLGSDLVHVAAFRDHVLAELTDHAKLGTMALRKGGLDVRTDAFQQSEGVDAADPLLPKDGWTGTLRVADQYAASLVVGRPGAPKFRRYWPVAERDRAITALAAWLKTQ